MNPVIQLLEALARDARPLDADGYAAAVDAVDGPARAALLARDPAAIAAALGLPPTLACVIATPDPGEPVEDDEPAEDGEPADGDDGSQIPTSPDALAA